MTTVRFTTVRDGELDRTEEREFDGFQEALEFSYDIEGDGVVGCVKVGDKIKRVF